MSDDQRRHVCDLFERRFGRPAEWVAVAPGRVNLIGEHVDYCGGFVLPLAIDRQTLIAAAAGPKPSVARIRSTALGREVEIPLDGPQGPPVAAGDDGWSNMIRGVIAGFGGRGVSIPAFDAIVDGEYAKRRADCEAAAQAARVMGHVSREYLAKTGRQCTMFTTRPAQGARLLPCPPED